MSPSAYSPLQATSPILSPTRFPFSRPRWTPSLFPHRIRRKLRSRIHSRRSPASSLTSLESSLDPTNTIHALRQHPWSLYDAQYFLLLTLGVCALCIIETYGPLFKTAFVAAVVTVLMVPVTRQFFLPFMPVATWLVFFYSCRSVSISQFLVHRSFSPAIGYRIVTGAGQSALAPWHLTFHHV